MSSDILNQYKSLTASSDRTKVSSVLNAIILAPPSSFDAGSRGDLIQLILQDVKAFGAGRLLPQDAAKALLAVKTLGREPSGSEVISRSENVLTLLGLQLSLKDYPDAASEALRCIANALLLIEPARHAFLDGEVNGAQFCIPMLDKASTPDQIFILSRILFLASASGSHRILDMVEEKYNGQALVDIIAAKIDLLITPTQNRTSMAREALTDVLKFAFYLLVHYPKLSDGELQGEDTHGDGKVLGDVWSSKLDSLLAPAIRVFLALTPMSPCPVAAPLSHAIHALISIPVNASLRPIWFPPVTTSSRTSSRNSPKSPGTPRGESSQPGSRSQSPGSHKTSTLDRAIAKLTAGRKSLSRSGSLSRPTSPSVTNPLIVLEKALELLDISLARYFPGKIDVDDPSVNTRVKQDTPQDSLDEMLSPLVVLLTRLCSADEPCRTRVRQFIVPDDLDRSSPLEDREDLLGRSLRMLGSVYHARLKDAIGEMLYAMADNNASTMSGLLGYGNVAGFLFNKGVLSAPGADPNAPTTTSTGEAINPITGTTIQPGSSSTADMTDEEKEREMEKLLVLFDRLEKTGALPKDQNPIRKAIQEGKLPNA
ncbi:hypothetical protein FA15DRAFT_664249 [Coprinopsis marcescibilis]|uniref:Guanine nucleotide exchange factor n=1 Tax=Coprinopsis marcescibilis TaxID=230819 RepID=A0A5C3LBD5_COPMA|nr:hypothetical protein FA15DRAFT_664249 [Coprinopsis marcescibilis]